MTRVALRGLAGRKVRALLTALAVVLGVAMISGSFVLGDTISKAFDEIFTGAYRQTDAVVSGKKLVDFSSSGGATVSDATLAKIRSLPDVSEASGIVLDLAGNSTKAELIDREGEPIQGSGNPTFGVGLDPTHPRFNPLRLVEGSWASGAGQVVIDAEAAREHDFAVGDTIRVAANGPARPFEISGLAQFGDVESIAGATFAIWDVPTARTMMGLHGYSAISVAAKDGVGSDRLISELRGSLPGTVQVKSGAEQAKADKKDIEAFVSIIRGFLLAFGGVALLVGGFVIFNTLSITVAQRTRELATLRTLGASRRQVLKTVVLEALVLGVLASVVGLFTGFGLAKLLQWVFDSLGLALPTTAPVYAAHTFVAALAVGIVVTVVAGLAPAVRATRVPPIAAVREGAVVERRKRLGPVAGGVLLAAAAAALGFATFHGSLGSGSNLLALAAGALLALVGLAAVASRLVVVLAQAVGLPARRLGGVAGRLASENAIRNPSRTAATAAALMIGLALVSFVGVLGAGLRGSLDGAITKQIGADYVVSSNDGWSPFPAAAGDAVAGAPGVVQASSIRVDRGLVGKSQATVNAVDPQTIGGLYRFDWKDGSSDAALDRLDRGGALVKQAFAKANHLAVGDRFTLTTAAGTPLALRVAGIFQPPRVAELLGGIVLGERTFDRSFPRPVDYLTLVRGSSAGALEAAAKAFPDAKVQTRAEFVDNQSSFIGQLLNLLYVLLALSVIVSLFGMINTLVLSVFERTRELGMLRAVGMSRRQARRMVRHESVITSLIGAALGLPLGVLLAGAVTHALGKYGVAFTLPVGSLVAFVVVAVVAGIVAAVAPARRAGRLDVLSALQYE